jgi:sugar O-acyltransferase (sialic acid O-acetyltransferase NeuD family)
MGVVQPAAGGHPRDVPDHGSVEGRAHAVRVVLLGGAGHASDVLGALEASCAQSGGAGPPHVVGFLADGDVDLRRFSGRGVPHLGGMDRLAHVDATHYLSCVGYPRGRKKLADLADAVGLTPLTVVHPRAWVAAQVTLGAGSVLLAGACVSPQVSLGRHVYLGQGCVIGHDCRIGDFASVLPGAVISGDTRLDEGCTVGANATVIEKRRVGAWSIVGAGAVVTRDIPPDVTAKGVPARF